MLLTYLQYRCYGLTHNTDIGPRRPRDVQMLAFLWHDEPLRDRDLQIRENQGTSVDQVHNERCVVVIRHTVILPEMRGNIKTPIELWRWSYNLYNLTSTSFCYILKFCEPAPIKCKYIGCSTSVVYWTVNS